MRAMPRVPVFAVLGTLGLLLPGTAKAVEGAAPPAPVITDVALGDGGTLAGQIVDAQGQPLAKTRVSIQDNENREIAAGVTDEQGYYSVTGLRGGVYQVVTAQGRGVYRLWSPGTAPPTAQSGALLVTGNVVRGTPAGSGPGSMKFFLNHPLVIGAAVATAIAVPVALSQHHHHPASP